jgi:hypothetical protein
LTRSSFGCNLTTIAETTQKDLNALLQAEVTVWEISTLLNYHVHLVTSTILLLLYRYRVTFSNTLHMLLCSFSLLHISTHTHTHTHTHTVRVHECVCVHLLLEMVEDRPICTYLTEIKRAFLLLQKLIFTHIVRCYIILNTN